MSVFTENFTGTDGAAWPSGWTNDVPNGSGPTTTIQTNRGRIGTTVGARDVYATRSAESLTESDVTVLMAATTAGASSINLVGLVSRFSAAATCYRARVRYVDASLQLTRNGTSVATASIPGGSIAAAWRMRMRTTTSGANALIQVRYWVDGAAEPSTWNIEYTDTAPLAAGRTGVYADMGTTSVTFDLDDYVRDDLVAAPTHSRTIRRVVSTHTG